MKKSNDGVLLESKLRETLKQYQRKNPSLMHRFPDTKSAGGNFLPPQPGDFMLLVAQGAVLIECKSSIKGEKLLSLAHHGATGKRQIAKHRLWHRAGHPSLYLYLDVVKQTTEWWAGPDVVNKNNKIIKVGRLDTLYDQLNDVLGELWK